MRVLFTLGTRPLYLVAKALCLGDEVDETFYVGDESTLLYMVDEAILHGR
jgi:hypothetical protein